MILICASWFIAGVFVGCALCLIYLLSQINL